MQLCNKDSQITDIIDEKRGKSFFNALAEFAKPTLISIENTAQQNAKQNTVTNTKERIKEFQKKIDVLYLNILMFEKGIQTVSESIIILLILFFLLIILFLTFLYLNFKNFY
jgi:hypothetical protein